LIPIGPLILEKIIKKDVGNLSKYYRKVSPQSVQRKNKNQNWTEKMNSVRFFSETIVDRGKSVCIYQKFATQSIQRKKPHQSWMQNKNSVYLPRSEIK
jgi:hypothetical protein